MPERRVGRFSRLWFLVLFAAGVVVVAAGIAGVVDVGVVVLASVEDHRGQWLAHSEKRRGSGRDGRRKKARREARTARALVVGITRLANQRAQRD